MFHLGLFTPTILYFLPKIVQVLLNTAAAFGTYTAVASVQRRCHVDISLRVMWLYGHARSLIEVRP